jgi:hypothetical protein
VPTSPATLAVLRSLLAARFPEKTRKPGGFVPTGLAAVDEVLGGGLAAGRLTEFVSAAPSSGGQLVLAGLLSATRTARQRVALVDAADGFAPEAVPADELRHLVWVRGRGATAALAAGDLLVRDGNYAVIALDLRGLAGRVLRKQPATAWYRLQRAAESGAAAVLVLTPYPLVPAVPWRLVLRSSLTLEHARWPRPALAAGLTVEVERSAGRQNAAETEELAG